MTKGIERVFVEVSFNAAMTESEREYVAKNNISNEEVVKELKAAVIDNIQDLGNNLEDIKVEIRYRTVQE